MNHGRRSTLLPSEKSLAHHAQIPHASIATAPGVIIYPGHYPQGRLCCQFVLNVSVTSNTLYGCMVSELIPQGFEVVVALQLASCWSDVRTEVLNSNSNDMRGDSTDGMRYMCVHGRAS